MGLIHSTEGTHEKGRGGERPCGVGGVVFDGSFGGEGLKAHGAGAHLHDFPRLLFALGFGLWLFHSFHLGLLHLGGLLEGLGPVLSLFLDGFWEWRGVRFGLLFGLGGARLRAQEGEPVHTHSFFFWDL